MRSVTSIATNLALLQTALSSQIKKTILPSSNLRILTESKHIAQWVILIVISVVIFILMIVCIWRCLRRKESEVYESDEVKSQTAPTEIIIEKKSEEKIQLEEKPKIVQIPPFAEDSPRAEPETVIVDQNPPLSSRQTLDDRTPVGLVEDSEVIAIDEEEDSDSDIEEDYIEENAY